MSAATLWAHALAALLFGLLAVAGWRRDLRALAVALGATALWALAAAGIDPHDVVTRVMDAIAVVAWLAAVTVGVRRGMGRLALLAIALPPLLAALLLAAVWRWPGADDPLLLARAVGTLVAGTLLALALHRDDRRGARPSRTIALRLLALAGGIVLAAALALTAGLVGTLAGDHARLAQTAFALGTTAALGSLIATPRLRAWTRVVVAKHLFRHRYEYRAEWLRVSATLGDGAVPLAERVVAVLADITGAPAGLLLDAGGAVAAAWRWAEPPGEGGAAFAADLARHREVVELDAARAANATAADGAAAPQWMLDDPRAWIVVPLVHAERLAGAVVLQRPPLDRRLDWEDFDLLDVVARQAASHLAEDRARAALAEAARFDEFNRKFAFIMHDLKNMVSQLTLVARNAERHAENPAFRADMVATLADSSARMTALLARLAQANPPTGGAPKPVALMELAERVAASRRAQHAIACVGEVDALVRADPVALEQLLGHLVQNAIEASPPAEPVTLLVHPAAIEVIDQGAGMSPAFIRERLFKPFDSAKPGGFGIGAYEARQLARAMGGDVTVVSREGGGARFRVTLPPALALGAAA